MAYKPTPQRKARIAAYRRSLEAIERRKANYQRPEVKAKFYAWKRKVPYASVLPFFLTPERTCWMCGESGATELDHHHGTAVIRGWAHRKCNAAEGMVAKSANPAQLAATLAQYFSAGG